MKKKLRNKTGIKIEGKLKIKLFDAVTKELKKEVEIKNLVVDDGLEIIAEAMGVGWTGFLPSGKAFQYCAVGDDDTSPDPSDVKLGNELDRVENSYLFREGASIIIDTFFGTDDGNGSLEEAGLFGYSATTTPDSGVLMTRTVFDIITKTTNETMIISWSITFSRS